MNKYTQSREIPEWTTVEKVDAVVAKQSDINGKEYAAIKQFWGAMDLISMLEDGLGKRLSLIPRGLRDLRMLKTVSERLFQKMLWSIPQKRLEMMKNEMRHYELAIYVSGASRRDVDTLDHTLIHTNDLRALMKAACSYECSMCMKCGKAARRCELYKVLTRAMPYGVDFKTETPCPFADLRIDEVFTTEEEVLENA